ncbi:MAG: hypothetical protein K2X47_15165 [Bdellovibrionales bacterium]|nr:hypothetical protein [Bdellovibrionales bacterium]
MNMSLFQKKRKPVSLLEIQEYRGLCEKTSQLLSKHGKTVRPFDDEAFPRLHNHTDPQRAIQNLGLWYEVLNETDNASESLLDDKRLVWRMIQKLKLTPTPDMMNYLEDGDTVEIYTTDNWQIFRNLRFFDFLQITIDEVATMIWSRDSKRKAAISMEALRLVLLIKTKQLRETFQISSIPKHEMSCTFSGIHQIVEIDLKIASPLFGKDGFSAYLITNRGKRLSS